VQHVAQFASTTYQPNGILALVMVDEQSK